MTNSEKNNPAPRGNFMKYSAIGFQIMAVFALGVFLGLKTDEWLKTSKPYFTLLFSLLFAFAGLYLGLRDFLRQMGKK
jgi:F0F1-type ATP synthase assembly protein I